MSYSGNLCVENRNGLIVDAEVFEANGTAERDAALLTLEQIPGTKPVSVGGDKGFDTFGCVGIFGWCRMWHRTISDAVAVRLMVAPRGLLAMP